MATFCILSTIVKNGKLEFVSLFNGCTWFVTVASVSLSELSFDFIIKLSLSDKKAKS